jgi:hypothetical protein
MPLAPMGCEAKVHKKTNKCSTWAYHSVDSWYIFTLPEHCCTHNCHIKYNKSKQLFNTVQLQHKRITNPSITHADKVMNALAECVKAIQGITSNARNSKAAQVLQHINATQVHVQANPHKFDETTTPDDIHNMQQVPRVQAPPSNHIPHTNDNRQITHSMHLQAPILRVPNDILTFKSISAPLAATTIKPRGKPTTLAAELSKYECHLKRQAT